MAEDKERAETLDRLSMVPGVDEAGGNGAGAAQGGVGDQRSEDIARRAEALRAEAPDGKFSQAAGGGAAGSGGTGGPAADPSDKGAYGGGGT